MSIRTLPDDNPIRAFVALDLDEATRAVLHEQVAALRRAPWQRQVRWVAPENWHVTLRFLGKVTPSQIGAFTERLSATVAALTPLTVTVGAPRLFPKPSRPRIIAATVADELRLRVLAQAVEADAVAAGLPPERRPFRGHVTLGRTRRGFPRSVELPVELGQVELPVEGVTLYRSELTRRGAVYTPLDTFAVRREA